MIGIIAAVTMNGIIGIDGKLPFDYPEDLKHFKKNTIDSVIVMGRKTFEGIGRPLPKRENIVITSRKIEIPGITCLPSLQSVLDRESIILRDRPVNIWFIGGASIYEEGMEYADKILLTLTPDVEKSANGIRFPWINPLKYSLTEINTLSEEKKLYIATYDKVIVK